MNLLVLGPKMQPKNEAVVEGLASLSQIKGRGTFPSELEHLTDADWDEIEVLLLTTMSGAGLEVKCLTRQVLQMDEWSVGSCSKG